MPTPAVRIRAALLTRLFAAMEQSQFDYVVMGDADRVPASVTSDVDLVVGPAVLPIFSAWLLKFCDQHRVRLIQAIQHEPTAFFYVLAVYDKSGMPHLLQLDVCSDYYRNGRRYLGAMQLIAGRERAKDQHGQPKPFWVPAPVPQFFYGVIKQIDKGTLTPEKGRRLTQAWRQAPDVCRKQIERFWPKPEHRHLIIGAAEENAWDLIRVHVPELRDGLHSAIQPSLGERWAEVKRRISRVLNPTGLWIALYGPDGSGKSSVMRGLIDGVEPAFWNVETMHLRPAVFERDGGDTPVTDPHGEPPRDVFTSVLKLVYYVLDYIAGYLVKVVPKLARATFVCFDRYYHDVDIDPMRYRYSGPSWLVNVLGRLVPQPDLYLFLDADTETVLARKKEVSYLESSRQRIAYKELSQQLEGAYVLNANKPLPEVVREARRVIVEHLAARTRLTVKA
ncbi:MAG: thymidylate kinase-like protein [Bacteroidota bacterium]